METFGRKHRNRLRAKSSALWRFPILYLSVLATQIDQVVEKVIVLSQGKKDTVDHSITS